MTTVWKWQGWFERLILAGMLAMAAHAGAQELTSPSVQQRTWPEVEAQLQRIAGAWQGSQSLRYECELEYVLKGTNVEKRDHYRVHLRALKPRHIAVKVYTNGSIMAIVYDGESIYTHSKGNRFSKAPLTGDLQTLLNTGRLASYPMILLELYVAPTPADFLKRFDDARIQPAQGGDPREMTLVLKRRRETITITLAPHGEGLMPARVMHEWTFDPEVLANTDPNLQLEASEAYSAIQTITPVAIEEISVRNVAMELMKELGLLEPDSPTTPTLPAATPVEESTSMQSDEDAAEREPQDNASTDHPENSDQIQITTPSSSAPMEP